MCVVVCGTGRDVIEIKPVRHDYENKISSVAAVGLASGKKHHNCYRDGAARDCVVACSVHPVVPCLGKYGRTWNK